MPPINKDVLELAVKVAVGSKGANADWINTPDKVADFLDAIAKKLADLNSGKA